VDFATVRGASYVVQGREVAPTTGTHHIQGYCEFKSQRTFQSVCKLLPGAHIEVAHGDSKQNREYCIKDGDFKEEGARSATQDEKAAKGGAATKDMWDKAKTAAKEGRLDDVPSQIFICHYSALRAIQKDYAQPPDDLPTEVKDGEAAMWIHGPSGCGKSRW